MTEKPGAGSDFPDVAETLYGMNKRARWVAEALSKFDNPDILDVGCGTGELLTIPIARRGYHITGTDFHLPSIEHARAVAGSAARFVHGTPHDAGGTYDVIILSEVLEHVHEPVEMLSDLRSRLKPGGSLLLTVPNGRGPFEIDQWFWKRNFLWIPRLHASYVAGCEASGRAATLNDDNPHVNFFTRRTLAKVVHSAGFEIAQWAPRSFICGSFPAIAIGALRLPTEAIARFNASVADKLPLSMASGWMLELKAR